MDPSVHAAVQQRRFVSVFRDVSKRHPTHVKIKQFARMVSSGPSFVNRLQAGEQLGAVLREQLGQQLGQQQELCVFGLVRGGKHAINIIILFMLSNV
jgi:hypothetical protein